MTADQVTNDQHADPNFGKRKGKIDGYEYVELLEELAANLPHKDIAEIHGRSWAVIDNFASQHRREINELKQAHAKDISGVWIARQKLRLKECATKYDLLDDILAEMIMDSQRDVDPTTLDVPLVLKITAEMRSHRREAAEEQGDLFTRRPNEGPLPAPVSFEVEHEGNSPGDGS